jgi:hypothetical protein
MPEETPEIVAFLLTSGVTYCRACRESVGFAPVLIKKELTRGDLPNPEPKECDFCGQYI